MFYFHSFVIGSAELPSLSFTSGITVQLQKHNAFRPAAQRPPLRLDIGTPNVLKIGPN